MKSARNKQIAEQFLSGTTTRDIAKEHGISHQRVSQLLRYYIPSQEIFKMAHARKKYKGKQSNPENTINTICPTCKTSFPHFKSVKRVYCSNPCRLNNK